MKQELQNAAIAEACGKQQLYAVRKEGFYYRPFGHGYTSDIKHAWHTTKQTAESELVSGEDMEIVPVPTQNYTGDLNAMHEAETVLKGQYWVAYFDLIQHTGKATGVRATAAQRAEAFLRTIGKWVEEEQEPCCQKCGEKLQTNRKHEGYLGYDILCGLCADDMRNRHE